MLFWRVEVSLYIFFLFFFFNFSIFSLFSRFSFILSDYSSDLNWDSKLDECKSKLKFMFEFKWNLAIFLKFIFL